MPDFHTLDDLLDYYKFPFELRPGQRAKVLQLFEAERSANFSHTGTGKTAMSTALALCFDADHNIVLCPPILAKQWARWLESVKNAGSIVIYRGTPTQRKEINLTDYKWIIMSYHIFKNDWTHLVKTFIGKRLMGIADEGNVLKNSSSENYKKFRDFFAKHYIQILTATPLSKPEDAYAYVKLKTPDVYRNVNQFVQIHVDKVDFFGNVESYKNLDLMQHNLMLNAVRLLKEEELAHLHHPNYIPIEYELASKHKKLYDQLAEEQLLVLADGGKIDATAATRLYNALQQIIVNWAHFSGEEDLKFKAAIFELIDTVADEIVLSDHNSSKLIIYTYYKMTSALVTEYLQNYNAVALYSEVSRSQQDKNVERFLDDPACRVLVAQPMSGGQGWNPQAVCSEILFAETPIIPAHFEQAVGRIYRDGQKNVPNVRMARAVGTIQERLFARLLDKDALVNKVQYSYQDLRDAIYGS